MEEEAFRYFDAKLDTWRHQVMREADSRIDRAEKAAAEKVESIRRLMKQVATVAGLVTIGGILTILQSIHTQAEQAGLGRVRAAAVEAERHRDAAGGIIETLRATSEQRANDAGLALIGTLRQEAERRLAEIRQFQEEAFAPDRGVIVDHGVIRVGGPNLEIALREPRTRTLQVPVNFSTPVRLPENVCVLLTELSNIELMPVSGGEAGRQFHVAVGALTETGFRADITVGTGGGDQSGRNGIFRLHLGWVAFRRAGRAPCPA